MEHKGDFSVARELSGYRINAALTARTISAQEPISAYDPNYLRLSAATQQDAVLPDATTLTPGWTITIEAAGAATVRVMKYDATTPTLLQAIAAGAVYQLILVANGTAAGTWAIDKIEATAQAARYPQSFGATTDWGSASGGYYTLTVPASTHGITANPNPTVYKLSGSDYKTVGVDSLTVLANGDVRIQVPETPDCRFAGLVVIA